LTIFFETIGKMRRLSLTLSVMLSKKKLYPSSPSDSTRLKMV